MGWEWSSLVIGLLRSPLVSVILLQKGHTNFLFACMMSVNHPLFVLLFPMIWFWKSAPLFKINTCCHFFWFAAEVQKNLNILSSDFESHYLDFLLLLPKKRQFLNTFSNSRCEIVVRSLNGDVLLVCRTCVNQDVKNKSWKLSKN